MAGRSRGGRDFRHGLEQLRADVVDKTQIQRVGQSPRRVAVKDNLFTQASAQALVKTIAQPLQALRRLRQAVFCELASLA